MSTDRKINLSVNVENRLYWEAAGKGKLVMRKCSDCGKLHHYPRTICPHCHSSDTAFVEVSGRGEIYSYSVTRQAKPPYVIAYVSLEEGVTMLTNIVDCDPDRLRIGDRVKVRFLDAGEGRALPVFAPA